MSDQQNRDAEGIEGAADSPEQAAQAGAGADPSAEMQPATELEAGEAAAALAAEAEDPGEALSALSTTEEDDLAASLPVVAEDPEDALSVLSAGGEADAGAALTALSAGEDVPAPTGPTGAPGPPGASPGGVGMVAGLRKQAADRNLAYKSAQVSQLQQTMIPILLVVSMLLLLVGIASVYMAVTSEEADRTKHAIILAVAAFPTALVLGGGAVMFQRDVKRAKGRRP